MVAKLVVIGGGKMGEALVAGLLQAGWAQPGEMVVVEASQDRRHELAQAGGLAERHPGLTVTAEPPVPAPAVLVAVKPYDVQAACVDLRERGAERVLSIAAGVTTSELEQWCPEACAVVRAMPNMGALVGSSATCLTGGRRASRQDLDWAGAIMGAVGLVVEVAEHLVDAVTGLSGSGPAYLMMVAEAMTEGGVLLGLPRSVAQELAAYTLLGSGRLLVGSGQTPEQVRAAVTSPGGTTAEGLRQLEAHGARAAFIEAVAASARRSRELRT